MELLLRVCNVKLKMKLLRVCDNFGELNVRLKLQSLTLSVCRQFARMPRFSRPVLIWIPGSLFIIIALIFVTTFFDSAEETGNWGT